MSNSITSDADSGQFPDLYFLPAQRLDSYIEQVSANTCPNTGTPLLIATSEDRRTALVFHPRCKTWDCPYCGEVNRAAWGWRATLGAKVLAAQGHMNFITLTPHERLDVRGSFRVLPSAWGKLNDRLRRAAAGEYLIVPEPHKTGKVHLHGLFSHDLPRRWWKDNARACGMGYQVDLQEVRNDGGVMAYVTKYLGKSLQYSNFAKGFHRVRTSRGWPPMPETALPGDWQIVAADAGASVAGVCADLRLRGFSPVVCSGSDAWKIVGPFDASE